MERTRTEPTRLPGLPTALPGPKAGAGGPRACLSSAPLLGGRGTCFPGALFLTGERVPLKQSVQPPPRPWEPPLL